MSLCQCCYVVMSQVWTRLNFFPESSCKVSMQITNYCSVCILKWPFKKQNKPRYPLDSDLFGGKRYLLFEQPRPGPHSMEHTKGFVGKRNWISVGRNKAWCENRNNWDQNLLTYPISGSLSSQQTPKVIKHTNILASGMCISFQILLVLTETISYNRLALLNVFKLKFIVIRRKRIPKAAR